jgi:hypothetical protein
VDPFLRETPGMETRQTAIHCEAPIRYLAREWRGHSETATIGTRETRRANTDPRTVPIRDARPLLEGPGLDLDREGFTLAKLTPGVSDFRDPAKVELAYYPQIDALMRELTGADRVFPYQHQLRTEDTSDFNNAYARFIHSDYDMENRDSTASAALRDWGVELDSEKQWEFAWYNLWQPIDWEVQQNPLAIIDSTSLDQEDMLSYYYTGSGDRFRSTMPVFNHNHRIFFFPRMQTDEIMVFKQLDTRQGVALSCPHTSFDDPTAPTDSLPRRSIETRTMCAFAKTG